MDCQTLLQRLETHNELARLAHCEPLTSLGRASDGCRPQPDTGENTKEGLRLKPQTPQQVADMLKTFSDWKQPLALSPNDALALETPIWLDIAALNQVVEYQVDDLVITVQTGVTVGRLKAILAQHGHYWPLRYPSDCLLLDVLAADIPALQSGLRRTLKEYVLGTQLADPHGELSKGGGKVVKNVTGYDLHKFYVGSHHAFGVITEVTLRLAAQPELCQGWFVRLPSLEAAAKWSAQLLERPHSTLEALELINWPLLPITLPCSADDSGYGAYIAASGPASLVRDFDNLLQDSLTSVSNSELYALSQEQQMQFADELASWEGNSLHWELGFPYNGWLEITQTLSTSMEALSDKPSRLQCRPALGLVQFGWADRHLQTEALQSALMEAKTSVQAADGWAQLRAFPDGWESWASAYNQPDSLLAFQLLQRLKKQFDPNAVLTNRLLQLA